ncbi:GNAT family N-acetyltransferase [Aeromonas bivalvium]|uniref:GNAT family N-acetyltransferase n=1 Tax=Aeromonas bivalvium TaxID=440079 RepID=UPI0005AA3966|nr:GNAT family N-acetyltransferase [Aeromonas bivalvium]
MRLEQAGRGDYPTLIALWEASVRGTHHFLPEEEIASLRELILAHYFDAVTLTCARDREGITGFCGVHEGNIEMLFVDPEAHGRGIGRLLVADAVHRLGASRVDVNEQNEPALGFYRRLGFEVVGRSAQDGQGKPYPLLHMALTGQ